MKVIYLTYDGLTDSLGQSQILPYLKGLSNLGNDITIISFEKQHLNKNLMNSCTNELNKYHILW